VRVRVRVKVCVNALMRVGACRCMMTVVRVQIISVG
jgi:hypothetical protein